MNIKRKRKNHLNGELEKSSRNLKKIKKTSMNSIKNSITNTSINSIETDSYVNEEMIIESFDKKNESILKENQNLNNSFLKRAKYTTKA